ncbi:ERV/ALR sulfhydryl oxidase domain-containing protein [Phlebopus sp. FC_14]|nr:ERV/ALR sulfhydryl oxidase domain-containing protein [Phlebopus sp. FC_14]
MSQQSGSSDAAPKATKPSLPPGMVIGPDGKPCKICTAFRYWKPRADSSSSSEKGTTGKKTTAAMMAALASGKGFQSDQPRTKPPNCPPDVEELGRATWTFLHTTAAYYPERPTSHQRANMLNLLHSLPVLYPCSHCASHLEENMGDNPPDVSGRVALSRWLCERHNEVNERLGKEKFDCAKTDERWRDGLSDGSCD